MPSCESNTTDRYRKHREHSKPTDYKGVSTLIMEKTCRNFGCYKKFKEDENTDESCECHISPPQFYDAMKKWPCCKKQAGDFDEFMRIKGCTRTKHISERNQTIGESLGRPEASKTCELQKKDDPVPIEPKEDENIHTTEMMSDFKSCESDEEPIEKRPKASSFPPPKAEYIELKPTKIHRQLEAQLKEFRETGFLASEKPDPNRYVSNVAVYCKNRGCNQRYNGPKDDRSVCYYHPGEAIFHECNKKWSCCNYTTSEFHYFLSHPGCKEGRHRWKENNEEPLRYDFSQRGPSVDLVVYAKLIDPEKSKFMVSNDQVIVQLLHDQKSLSSKLKLRLAEKIVPENCTVEVTPFNVVIRLKKLEDRQWNDFVL